MKILILLKSHNQIRLLPYAVDFYHKSGLEVCILDHCSSDGTLEWLDRRRIPYYTINDLSESFSRAKQNAIEKFSPDWLIVSDLNEYIVTPSLPLTEIVRSADERGINSIKCRRLEFYHTGEEVCDAHPKDTFFYYRENETQMSNVSIRKVSHEKERSCVVEGFVLSYEKAEGNKDTLLDVRNFEPLRKFISS